MTDYGYKPPPMNLMPGKLTLNPETEAMLASITAMLAAKTWMDTLLNPNWDLHLPLFQSLITAPPTGPLPPASVFANMPPPAPAPAPPHPGPEVPRAGELKDAADAVFKTTFVQRFKDQSLETFDSHLRKLKVEWSTAKTPEKAVMISTSVIFAAGVITPILANKKIRVMAFDMITDVDLPVPGLKGFSFKILQYGGGLSGPTPIKGLTFDTQLSVPDSGQANYKAMLNLDVVKFLGLDK